MIDNTDEKDIELMFAEARRYDLLTAERYAADKDASIIWEGHKAGRDIGYCHLEKMHNLEALPDYGFTVSCFPHKVRGGSAGWTRAVAIIDED